MLDSFKEVLEKEREAERVVIVARKEAKKIETDAQEKAELVYRQTFQETINEARRHAIETKERAEKEAEAESQVFMKRAEVLKTRIKVSGQQNFNEAVDEVLNEFLL
ncbi:MAG: hypothetical protein IAX21_04920 [Candidatus Bathyarchaeota archaeon]|nr:hypothetical protein [Candidatus Bathyarchaeum tardum]WGM89709.1 MAG: hypothetical protein NUK63_00865 [Candidatus Bathyarchaeum tardum]WNZ30194.1 MAG: hypothetical protein IAX21_04920 [Candidatus Bathyarchaeota archaeon]